MYLVLICFQRPEKRKRGGQAGRLGILPRLNPPGYSRQFIDFHLAVSSDKHFRSLFRTSKTFFSALVEDLTPFLTRSKDTLRTDCLSPLEIVGIALYRLGTTSETTKVAETFSRGCQTVQNCVEEFCSVVVDQFWSKMICMPSSAEEVEWLLTETFRLRSLPGCIGAIDGKHFNISAGADDWMSYKNYKGTCFS